MGESRPVSLERDPTFLWEVWSWFVVGVITIFVRMGVRLRTVGWRMLDGDDYLALFSLAMYTADAFLVHMIYHSGTNVDVPPGQVDSLSDADVATFVWGSQVQIAAWYTYTALIWTMKFMVLFFYRRLMTGTLQMRLIKYFFWLCGATYLAVFLTITLGCRPFNANWQVRPLPPRQCTFKPQNFYVGAVLNVLTDAVLLSLPIPMLWTLKVNLRKKIAVGILLSSGLFVIAAAIVRAVLTLGATPSGLNINRWGVRETIVGILTVNMPILPPMFKKTFWKRGGYESSFGGEEPKSKNRYGLGTFELRSTTHSSRNKHNSTIEIASHQSHGSQENIIKEDDLIYGSRDVVVETQIEVLSHVKDDRSSSRDEESGDWGRASPRTNYNTSAEMRKSPYQR